MYSEVINSINTIITIKWSFYIFYLFTYSRWIKVLSISKDYSYKLTDH